MLQLYKTLIRPQLGTVCSSGYNIIESDWVGQGAEEIHQDIAWEGAVPF